jgi:hypothetical protein
MNTLGSLLTDSAARATGFAVLGIVFYLVLRRWSPAAGALGALSALAVMAMVWVLAFLPLPRWDLGKGWELLPVSSIGSAAKKQHMTAGALSLSQGNGDQTDQEAAIKPAERPPDSLTSSLLQALSRLGDTPGPLQNQSGWGWRGWIAVAVLASIGIGLVRLATGLWAMRRLAVRSLPLDDVPLIDSLAVLRAEMGCVKPVEVRLSRDLNTPATIGFLRRLILLPDGWQAWDESEQRAVLAHELAHVCRGDFAAGLLAQFSLALQFYHPLAHWISFRLRLDQELAADAWSARVAGGNLPYLTVLAQMALRQDDRVATWPARAFLPTRGTLVRRIEMLRSKRPIRHASLSQPLRFVTLAALASLGLIVAGLRSPLSAARPQREGGSTQTTPFQAAPTITKSSFDLAYLPAETRIVLAFQPAALLGRPEMVSALKAFKQGGPLGEIWPVPPEEVEQLLVFWEGSAAGPANAGSATFFPPPSGLIVRLKNAGETMKLVNPIVRGAEERQHSGQKFYRPAGGANQSPMSAYLPDERTAVLAHEDLLLTLIEDRKGPVPHQSWSDSWSLLPKGQVAAAVDARWLRRRYNQAMAGAAAQPGQPVAGNPQIEMISPLLEKVQSYALSLDLNRELKGELIARVNSAEDVKAVAETLQALLTLARNAVPSLKQNARGQSGRMAEAHEWAVNTFADLLDKAALESSGPTIHLRSTSPVDMAEAARVATMFLTSARGSASRTVSVNNLKQIGLAFHNYHAANGHFPPQVLHGGKSGQVPYSWRVAILPYIEQAELYNAYNFDEPWDGPSNSKLLERMPAIYAFPQAGGPSKTHTSYFVFSGSETLLGKGDTPAINDITDGTSNTILAVEARREVPWTKPEDIPFNLQGAPPRVGGFTDDGGFNALFGDGSVRYIKNTVAPDVLKALITRAGGEVIASDSF